MNETVNEPHFAEDTVSFINQFRNHIRSGNKILALNEFINRCKTDSDIIPNYIHAGGTVFDIMKCLEEANRKSDVPYTVCILAALYHVAQKSLTDELYLQSNIEEAFNKLLDKHSKFLEGIITDRNCRGLYKRPIFNILTAMVRLSLMLARRILHLFKFDRNVLGGYIRNNKNVVRVSIVRLVIAFLEEGNTVLIGELLDKHFLVTGILLTLHGDPIDIRKTILILLLEKVVKNSSISKTIKMRTFNTQILNSLVGLYDAQQDDENFEIPKLVHDLLMLLCTSTKLGILFHEAHPLATDRENISNKLIFSCLEAIKTPCDDANLKAELVREILSKTGLTGSYIRLQMGQLSSNELDANLLYFIADFIKTKANYQSDIVQFKTIDSVVSNCIVPAAVLRRPEFKEDYFNSNENARSYLIFFLRICLSSLQDYLTSIDEFDLIKGVKNDETRRYLYDVLPCGTYLINAWNRGPFEGDQKLNWHKRVLRKNYYDDLICVTEAYNVIVPYKIDAVRMKFATVGKLNVTSDILLSVYKLFASLHPPKSKLSVLKAILLHVNPTDIEQRLILFKHTIEVASMNHVRMEECIAWLDAFKTVSGRRIKCLLIRVFPAAFRMTSDVYPLPRRYKWIVPNKMSVGNHLFDNIAKKINGYSDLAEFVYFKISPFLIAFLEVLMLPETTSKWNRKEIAKGQKFLHQLLTNVMYFQESTVKFVKKIMRKYNGEFIPVPSIEQHLTEKPFPVTTKRRNTGKLAANAMKSMEFTDDLELMLFVRRCVHALLVKIENQHSDHVAYGQFVDNMFDVILSDRYEWYCKFLCIREYFIRVPILEHFMGTVTTENGDKFNVITHIAFKLIRHVTDREDPFMKLSRIRFMMFACDQLSKETDFIEGTVCDEDASYPDEILLDLPSEFLETVIGEINKSRNLRAMDGWYNLICRLFSKEIGSLNHIQRYIRKRLDGPNMACNILVDRLRSHLESYPTTALYVRSGFIRSLLKSEDESCYELLHTMIRLADCNVHDLLLSVLVKIQPISFGSTSLIHLLRLLSNYCDFDIFYFICARNLCEQFISLHCQNIDNILEDYDQKRLRELETLLNYWKEENLINPYSVVVLTTYFLNSTELYYLAETLMKYYAEDREEQLLASLCICVGHFKQPRDLLNWTYWRDFSTEILNHGMKYRNPFFIKALNDLITPALKTENFISEINVISEKMMAHSSFLTIALSKDEVKANIFQLYLTLISADASITSAHLSLLFSIYEATLQESDQLVLKILHKYEERGIVFNEYRPYLWGKEARMYYNIHSNQERNLLNQPTTTQVLNSLDQGLVMNTIHNYPFQRSIRINQDDTYECSLVYDPAFYLPLFTSILAPEMITNVNKFVRSGALALIVCSLCSKCERTRRAAYFCLARFLEQLSLLQQSRKKEYCTWFRFVKMLVKGINKDMPPRELGISPTLPPISAVFYAEMTLILTRSYDPLFVPVRNYFLNRNVFEINRVRFLSNIFTSFSDPNCKCYQKWILKMMSCNTVSKSSYQIMHDSSVFLILMMYCDLPVCDQEVKTLVLETLIKSEGFFNSEAALWLYFSVASLTSEEDIISYFKILKVAPPDVVDAAYMMSMLKDVSVKQCNLTRRGFRRILNIFKTDPPSWLFEARPFSDLVNMGRFCLSENDHAAYSRALDSNEDLTSHVQRFLVMT